MDPYIRDQLSLLKNRMVKNIELVGKYSITDLMQPDEFEATAMQLAKLEAKEMHFIGAFETADVEPDVNRFQEKFDSLIARPDATDIAANPVVQRCKEFCREKFHTPTEGDESMNDSQELAITETLIATTDPFTKRPLKNPLVNRKCEHIYERETIFEILARKSRTRCPVMGCGNRDYITKDHLYDDPYVRAQLRNQGTANDTDDSADETIEDSEVVQLNETERRI